MWVLVIYDIDMKTVSLFVRCKAKHISAMVQVGSTYYLIMPYM